MFLVFCHLFHKFLSDSNKTDQFSRRDRMFHEATREDMIFYEEWFRNNWTISLYPVALYLMFLVVGTQIMKDRKPFKLNFALGLWSLSLAVMSLLGSVRCVSGLARIISGNGILYSFCHAGHATDSVTSMWVIIFALSKVPELIDTVFIVLRKQKLIFLHWYHHLLTVIFCFHAIGQGLTGGILWTASLNYTVHVFMYSYFTIRAFKLLTVPSFVNQFITLFQIAQMITLLVMYSLLTLFKLTDWKDCDTTLSSAVFGFLVTFTYLILFLNFYHTTYRCPPASKQNGVKRE